MIRRVMRFSIIGVACLLMAMPTLALAGTGLIYTDTSTLEVHAAAVNTISFSVSFADTAGSTVKGMANGFRIYSPDGATWTATTGNWNPAIDWSNLYFDSILSVSPVNVDGTGSDTIGFDALAFTKAGLADGFDEITLEIGIGPISVDDTGKTICFDTAYYPPMGTWLWSTTAGSLVPDWGGPYCFKVAGPRAVLGVNPSYAGTDCCWDFVLTQTFGQSKNIMEIEATVLSGGVTVSSATGSPGADPPVYTPGGTTIRFFARTPDGLWADNHTVRICFDGVGLLGATIEFRGFDSKGRSGELVVREVDIGTGGECADGACCLPDGTCIQAVEGDCIASGGLYQGDGTTCIAGVCNGDIAGYKFHDLNANGVRDAGEPGIPGVEINLQGPTSSSVLTGVDGFYQFSSVPAADYKVYETVPSDKVQTAPGTVSYSVTLPPQVGIVAGDFGNADTICYGTYNLDTCLAGNKDNFATGDGPEPAFPDADLFSLLSLCTSNELVCNPGLQSEFDCPATNNCFGHTFSGCWDTTCLVLDAKLGLKIRATGSFPPTDRIQLLEDDVVIWTQDLNTLQSIATGGMDIEWNSGDELEMYLDLADLPPDLISGNTNFLAAVQDGNLSVWIHDDTEVDYLELIVETCCKCDDLVEVINTAWDESSALVIGQNLPDDRWRVVAEPANGATNQIATVTPLFSPGPGFSNSDWLGVPFGIEEGYYWFEYAFCLNPDFSNAFLHIPSFEAKDFTWIYLNDNLVAGPLAPGPPISLAPITDQSLFKPGYNRILVKLGNHLIAVETAFILEGAVIADNGVCCDTGACCDTMNICDETDAFACIREGGNYLGPNVPCPAECDTCFVAGDLNGDGVSPSLADLVLLSQMILQKSPAPIPIWTADYNGDCVVDNNDLIDYKNYFTFGTPLPATCACQNPTLDFDCCFVTPGNVNTNLTDLIDISDLTYLVAFMFGGGMAPLCIGEADINGIAPIDISDLTYLVAYMFGGGPAPPACP